MWKAPKQVHWFGSYLSHQFQHWSTRRRDCYTPRWRLSTRFLGFELILNCSNRKDWQNGPTWPSTKNKDHLVWQAWSRSEIFCEFVLLREKHLSHPKIITTQAYFCFVEKTSFHIELANVSQRFEKKHSAVLVLSQISVWLDVLVEIVFEYEPDSDTLHKGNSMLVETGFSIKIDFISTEDKRAFTSDQLTIFLSFGL